MTSPADRRTRVLALLLATPALLTALAMCALETWRWIRPDAPLFVPPAAATMADAIARDDARGAYAFIRAGQDPNGVIAVRHDVLTGGRRVEVPPLLWAVATQSDSSVALLLGFGARPDAPARRQAVCLAIQLGLNDIVRLLELAGPEGPAEPCPSPPAGAPGAVLPVPR